jgi:short-subunit dehydrogenase
LAQELVRDGYWVGITGRRAELLDEIAVNRPEDFVAAVFDATEENAAAKLAELIAELGGMELFVFCSGTGDINPELDYAMEERANRLNVDAFTRLCGAAYNYMQESGGGHIAAVTSVMGLRGSGAAPAYAASKADQMKYLEGLRQRSVKSGRRITVTDLRPGSVDTGMMKGEGHFWIATPEQAAVAIMKAIRRRKAVQYVTPRWTIVGSLLKRLPRTVYNRM